MNTTTTLFRKHTKFLLITTIVMFSLFFAFFITHTYLQNINHAQEYELKRLSSIAKTIALNIDGDAHEELVCAVTQKDGISKNGDLPAYQKIHQLLKETQSINGLKSPIYTLFRADLCATSTTQNTLLFGVSSTVPYFRHAYETAPTIHHREFDNGAKIAEYEDEHGRWLSAFHPIKNSAGKTVAIVQVDERFGGFVHQARMDLLSDSLLALLVLMVLSVGFVYIYRALLAEMTEMHRELNAKVTAQTDALKNSNAALVGLNEKLESRVTARTLELQSTNQLLQQSNERLTSFAHIASHDLKAPLRIMKSFGQLLRRKYKDLLDEDGKEYLDFITTNAQNMTDLINDILTISMLEHQNKSNTQRVELNEVVHDVLANLRTEIQESKAEIYYANMPEIEGYKSEFVQLLQNLISNSIKYSRPTIAPIIHLTGKKMGNEYHLIIEDNGLGISEKAQKHIFAEFERGDATDDDGHGIGLATCQRIVEDYHGEIMVNSTVGIGTTFTCVLRNRTARIEDVNAVSAALLPQN